MHTDQNTGTTVLDEAYLHGDSQMLMYTHPTDTFGDRVTLHCLMNIYF